MISRRLTRWIPKRTKKHVLDIRVQSYEPENKSILKSIVWMIILISLVLFTSSFLMSPSALREEEDKWKCPHKPCSVFNEFMNFECIFNRQHEIIDKIVNEIITVEGIRKSGNLGRFYASCLDWRENRDGSKYRGPEILPLDQERRVLSLGERNPKFKSAKFLKQIIREYITESDKKIEVILSIEMYMRTHHVGNNSSNTFPSVFNITTTTTTNTSNYRDGFPWLMWTDEEWKWYLDFTSRYYTDNPGEITKPFINSYDDEEFCLKMTRKHLKVFLKRHFIARIFNEDAWMEVERVWSFLMRVGVGMEAVSLHQYNSISNECCNYNLNGLFMENLEMIQRHRQEEAIEYHQYYGCVYDYSLKRIFFEPGNLIPPFWYNDEYDSRSKKVLIGMILAHELSHARGTISELESDKYALETVIKSVNATEKEEQRIRKVYRDVLCKKIRRN